MPKQFLANIISKTYQIITSSQNGDVHSFKSVLNNIKNQSATPIGYSMGPLGAIISNRWSFNWEFGTECRTSWFDTPSVWGCANALGHHLGALRTTKETPKGRSQYSGLFNWATCLFQVAGCPSRSILIQFLWKPEMFS